MCGIFGWVMHEDAPVSPEQRAALGALLAYFNDTRGKDSWGVYFNSGTEEAIKRGLGLMTYSGTEYLGHRVVMAHCRWATHGDKTVENSHPFELGRIVGAHNGVIYNHSDLNKKFERDFDVDSQHIFAHLNENRSLEELEGYGAIEYIDREAEGGGIRLCRFPAGSLEIVGIGAGKKQSPVFGTIWSSDGDHLKTALRAARIEHFAYQVPVGDVFRATDEGLFKTNQELKLGYKPKTVNYGTGTGFSNWRGHFSVDGYYENDYATSYVGGVEDQSTLSTSQDLRKLTKRERRALKHREEKHFITNADSEEMFVSLREYYESEGMKLTEAYAKARQDMIDMLGAWPMLQPPEIKGGTVIELPCGTGSCKPAPEPDLEYSATLAKAAEETTKTTTEAEVQAAIEKAATDGLHNIENHGDQITVIRGKR